MKIRKAVPDDLSTIVRWRAEAAAWLHRQGSDQWNDSGLSRDAFIKRVTDSIRTGETWIAEDDDGSPLGTIAVDLSPDPGLWREEELKVAFVVHRMITDRSAVGKGVGARLLDHAEYLARRAGRKTLILDAWSSNRGLHAYYESQGFRHVRTVPDHYTPSATLFERPVTETAGGGTDQRRLAEGIDFPDRILLESRSTLPYYGNYSLTSGATVTQAVVVVHGINRNAEDYFRSIDRAAADLGVTENTIIVAPRFQIEQDEREGRDAYWTDSGRNSWKDGGGALAPAGLSSFTVMDEVLTALADKNRFPQLVRITLVGHSAGGQFTQRYAAGGRAPDTLRGVTIGYVTANPSSYLYLNLYRPMGENLRESCPGYNHYKYGLERRNEYCNGLNEEQIRQQYINRRVTYLLGSADVDRDDDLETDCAANAQGNTRFQRGRFYYSALRKFFPSASHTMVIVPEVGHNHDAMFNSAQGKVAIFRNL